MLVLAIAGLQSEIDASSRSLGSDDPSAHLEHKVPLEMYAFLLQWFITGAENAAGKGDDDLGPNGKKVSPTHWQLALSCLPTATD